MLLKQRKEITSKNAIARRATRQQTETPIINGVGLHDSLTNDSLLPNSPTDVVDVAVDVVHSVVDVVDVVHSVCESVDETVVSLSDSFA